MINPALLLKAKAGKAAFMAAHPKFVPFLYAVRDKAMQEGTVIEMSVKTPDGKTLQTNLKLQASDMETYHTLMEAFGVQEK